LASACTHYGLSDDGTVGTIWQSTLLLAALANSIYFIDRFQSNAFYTATIGQAFIGIFAALRDEQGTLVLQVITALAFLLL